MENQTFELLPLVVVRIFTSESFMSTEQTDEGFSYICTHGHGPGGYLTKCANV